MQPPYHITSEILRLVSIISEKIGRINAHFLDKPSTELRKENRIKTIHSSLGIEGNTLTEEQITALMDGNRVVGSASEITEVLNAIEVYKQLNVFNANSVSSFLSAHRMLMQGLVQGYGKFRTKGVGIVAGEKIAHLAPPAENVPHLMHDLFRYLKSSKEITLIKSCVFHYELEFIHPFLDGNGRMGRLWQTIVLMKEFPIFEFIPFETLIQKNQSDYYKALSDSDKSGNSTPFIEYMLSVIDKSLNELLDVKGKSMSAMDRVLYFKENAQSPFDRKEYMSVFKGISSATASRDLKLGVEQGVFTKQGDKTMTKYFIQQA
jgi:Fic family protein